jgi:hypothetical protein
VKRAIRTVAALFGAFTGIAGSEHGVFEVLQGYARPESLMIASMGPPCDPEVAWHACEPAMTVVPSYLISGILSIALGAIVLVWSLAFVGRKRGGLVLMLLSVALLLVGGGIFPPVFGILAGWVGTRVHTGLPWWRRRREGAGTRLLAALWPWPAVAFGLWALAQWTLGAISNDLMRRFAILSPSLLLLSIVLTILSAFARDVRF